MKRICTLIMAGTMAFACLGQSAQGTFVASISGGERLSLVRTSIDIPTWHEKSFWPVYEEYIGTTSEVSVSSYRALDDLARTDRSVADTEAFANAQKALQFRAGELEVLRKYYTLIGRDFNGYIAMQFLQTEAMLDLMESARIYSNSQWQKFRFHPGAISRDQVDAARRNIITKALAITEEQKDSFWSVYAEYQEERDAVLGEDYDMISVFAGDASGFTPALAKRLGYDFLTLMERDLKLKEKYFSRMNESVGSSLASRFLAWEDYYSIISKMHAWAESE